MFVKVRRHSTEDMCVTISTFQSKLNVAIKKWAFKYSRTPNNTSIPRSKVFDLCSNWSRQPVLLIKIKVLSSASSKQLSLRMLNDNRLRIPQVFETAALSLSPKQFKTTRYTTAKTKRTYMHSIRRTYRNQMRRWNDVNEDLDMFLLCIVLLNKFFK